MFHDEYQRCYVLPKAWMENYQEGHDGQLLETLRLSTDRTEALAFGVEFLVVVSG